MQSNVLEKLFLLFVFLLPWQTVYLVREVFVGGEKWQFGTVGLYLSFLVLILFYISLFLQNRSQAQSTKQAGLGVLRSGLKKKYAVLAGALICWLGLSFLWAADPTLVAFKGILLILALGLPFVAHYHILEYDSALKVLLLSLFIHAVIGLWQFVSQDSFSSVLLGISAYDVYQGGVSVIETDSGRWLRAYGGQVHPNIFGGLMAVGALLSIGVWLKSRVQKNTFLLAGLSFVASMTLFAALLASFSRSALAGFILGLGVFLYFARSEFKKWYAWATLLIGLILIAGMFFHFYGDLWQTRSAGEARLEQKSSDERVSQVSESLSIIKEHHLFGTGIGNYTAVLAERNPDTPIWQIQPVHNLDLLITAELGIIGAIIFGTLIILWAFNFFKGRQKPFSITQLSILASLTALTIPAILDHWLWTSHTGLLLALLLTALLKEKRR